MECVEDSSSTGQYKKLHRQQEQKNAEAVDG